MSKTFSFIARTIIEDKKIKFEWENITNDQSKKNIYNLISLDQDSLCLFFNDMTEDEFEKLSLITSKSTIRAYVDNEMKIHILQLPSDILLCKLNDDNDDFNVFITSHYDNEIDCIMIYLIKRDKMNNIRCDGTIMGLEEEYGTDILHDIDKNHKIYTIEVLSMSDYFYFKK